MNGIELARRAVQVAPGMKVIFASGYGAAVDAFASLPHVVLPKPYTLRSWVKRWSGPADCRLPRPGKPPFGIAGRPPDAAGV